MPEPARATLVDDGGVEELAQTYLRTARGDARAALAAVVRDALADLDHEERRLAERIRLISRGYARGAIGGMT